MVFNLRLIVFSVTAVTFVGAQAPAKSAAEAVEYTLVEERIPFPVYVDGESKIAVGPGGDVYYIDVNRSRILRFTATGTLAGAWGSRGSGPGEFDAPYDVKVHPGGDVYVVDSYNHRVQVFTADGTYVRELGWKGSGDGELFYPRNVAFRADGEVLVGDSGNSRVMHFSADGAFLGQWGGEAEGDTNLAGLVDLEVAPDDSVFVINVPWIQRFSAEGDFLGRRYIYDDLPRSWAKNEIWVEDLAFGPDSRGFAVPFWAGIGVFSECNFAVPPLIAWNFEGGEENFDPHAGSIAVSPAGIVYVSDSYGHYIQYFGADGKYLGWWPMPSLPDGEFGGFADVAVGSGGETYVLDGSEGRVQYFDAGGNFVGKWGTPYWASDIVVASDGDVYVSDWDGGEIQRFSPTGYLLDSYGSWEMDIPVSPCDNLHYSGPSNKNHNFYVGPEGDLYILDSDRHYVHRLAAPGDVMEFGVHDRADRDDAIWGGFGFGPGRFCCPVAVAVAADGVAYVVDCVNDRIQCFYPDGSFIREWGSKGDGNSEFGHPSDIALGVDGDVYVADHDNGRFQRFTADGEYLGSCYTKGKPFHIAVAPAGDVYVITARALLHYRPIKQND